MRDIYTAPRVGDRVQIIPRICHRLPEPLTVTEITASFVCWHRPVADQHGQTAVALWRNPRSLNLELLEAAEPVTEGQADMFGGAA